MNSVIYKYLKKHQEEPESRIFAPLAESYRKAGLVREAIEIAREGLQIHPHFIGGKVALARALFDQGLYHEVVDTLSQVVRDAPDNLVAQRVLGDACLMMGLTSDALIAYKMLLYFSPNDEEIGQLVKELETKAYALGDLAIKNDPPKNPAEGFEISNLNQAGLNSAQLNPEIKHKVIQSIELLQNCLQSLERYKLEVGLAELRKTSGR